VQAAVWLVHFKVYRKEKTKMETKVMNCIMCPMGCEMTVTLENGKFVSVTGNTCPRGAKYAETEVTDPRRMLTTTVRIQGGLLPLLPVVSADVLPKGKIADCVAYLRNVTVQAPVKAGDVIVPDILGLGVNIVASRDM
jgi:CxxC motif-containing protein